MATPRAAATAGHPVLAGLLDQVPRLRKELPGWAESQLMPVLAAFHEDATDAQIATALAMLREVLRDRADVDPWLGAIAELGMGEGAGPPMSMTKDSDLAQHIPLAPERIPNRTVVEQARRLGEALTATSAKVNQRSTPPPQSRPDTK